MRADSCFIAPRYLCGNVLCCPGCGHHRLQCGPRGAGSVNVRCPRCEARWNLCAGFGLEPINAMAREAADGLRH